MAMSEHTRMSIHSQLAVVLNATGRSWHLTSSGQLGYIIGDRFYTPEEAADSFLPGGFAGSFGRSRTDLDTALAAQDKQVRAASNSQDDSWTPEYERWRHGGWYVTNVRYPSGAVGCVSRNYPDHKWRIVCDDRPGSYPGGPDDHTYPSRDAAARAERELARAKARELPHATSNGTSGQGR